MRNPRLLDKNLNEVRRLHPISLTIDEKLVPLSYANITLDRSEVVPERSMVELFTENGSAGIFRTRAPSYGYNAYSEIQLDHAIAELGDFLVPDVIDEECSCQQAIQHLMSYYRGRAWQLGDCDSIDYVVLKVDHDNLLESIISILDQTLDYAMTFDFSTRPWTFHVKHKETTVTAEGRLSRNISSVRIKYDDKDLCTRVYVKGLPLPPDREDNEDLIGWMDADTIDRYGIIEHEESGGSNLTQEQAERLAYVYLESHKEPSISVEIEATDLSSITGESFDAFKIGKRFKLIIPEDNVVINEVITAISWSIDSVRITLGDDRDPSLSFYQKLSSSAKTSASTAKAQDKTNEQFVKNFVKTDEYGAILQQAGMQLDANGLIVYARDNVNNIGSMFKVQNDLISQEVEDRKNADDTFTAKLTVQANKIDAEVTRAIDQENILKGQLTVESNKINAEVTRAKNAETLLSGRITVEANKIEQEVRDRTNATNTLSGRITTEAGRITQIVSAVGSGGEVTAASIVLAINEAGESEARIDANKVYIGNQKSTTVINGKLNASDVTANYIKGKIGDIAQVVMNGASVVGDLYIRNGSGQQQNASAAIWDIQLTQSGNTYTLKRKRIQDADYVEIGSFSRAVSSWSVGGGSGKVNVTANPQNQTKQVPVSVGGPNSITNNGSYTYKVYYENADGDDVETGATMGVSVNVSKAINSWSVTGGNAAVKVTAQPQNQSKSVNLAVSGPGSITSNGTYTYKAMYEDNDGDDSDSGAFRNVTVDVPTGGVSVGSVDLTAVAVSTYQPTGYDGAVYLTELPNAIKNNRNTYVWFKVRVYDDQGEKLYTKNYYCASA